MRKASVDSGLSAWTSPTLQRKVFTRFLAVLALLCAPAIWLTLRWYDQTARQEAEERVRHAVETVRHVLTTGVSADERTLSALAKATEGLEPEDRHARLEKVFRDEAFDFGGMFDPVSLTGRSLFSGRPFGSASVFARVWERRGTQAGFLLLPLEAVAAENPGRAEEIRHFHARFPLGDLPFNSRATLACLVWGRTATSPSAPLLYAGRILRLDNRRLDELAGLLFPTRFFQGKPVATLTLFQESRRIATTVVGQDGRRAVGTAVSSDIYRQCVLRGEFWLGRAWVVDRWYLAAYEPIRDLDQRVIGLLYVGILEDMLLDTRNRMVFAMLGVFTAGLALAVLASLLLSRSLGRPLKRLTKSVEAVGQGALASVPDPNPGDSVEVRELLAAFRGMITALRERDLSLHEANVRLRDINVKLASTNRNYLEMLGFVTHELSNMVGVLLLDACSLRDALKDRLSTEEGEWMASLLQYLAKFKEIIKNYLDLSRIEKDRLEVRKVPMNLWWDSLQPAAHELAGKLAEAAVQLETAPDLASLELSGDPTLLRVVFFNLLGNAVKYGRQGGKIRIFAELADEQAQVHVWNAGEGIPPAEAAKLGEKFYRPQTPAGRQAAGTGLGLYISREIVERHGGALTIESQEGAWADFIVTLPIRA